MKQHVARELAQVCLLSPSVADVDVLEDPDGCTVEVVVRDHRIRPRLLGQLAALDVSLDPDGTATRGDPTHTVVVAR